MDIILLSLLFLVSSLPAFGAGYYVRKQVSSWVLVEGTEKSFIARAVFRFVLVHVLLMVLVYAISIPSLGLIVSLLDEGSRQGASMVLGLGFIIVYPVFGLINLLLGATFVGLKTRRAWKYRMNGIVQPAARTANASIRKSSQILGQGILVLLVIVFSYQVFAPAVNIFGPEIVNFFRSTTLACENLPKNQQRPNPFDECIIKKAENDNNSILCEQLEENNKEWYDSESAVNYARCKAPFINKGNNSQRQDLCNHVFSKYEGHNLEIVEPFVREFGCDMDEFNNLDPWARQS
jgi:hypothetical protein